MRTQTTRILEHYEDKLMGPYTINVLNSAEEITDSERGTLGISVPDAEGLAVAIAIALACMLVKLINKEVLFIRQALKLDTIIGDLYSAALGVSPVDNRTELESNPECDSSDIDDRMSRVLIAQHLSQSGHIYPNSPRQRRAEIASFKPGPRTPGTYPTLDARLVQTAVPDVRAWDVVARFQTKSSGEQLREKFADRDSSDALTALMESTGLDEVGAKRVVDDLRMRGWRMTRDTEQRIY